jgi:hypothetical protein
MVKYNLEIIKELNGKEIKKFLILFEKFKSYDKFDIIIELIKKKNRKFKNENIYS